VKQLRRRSVTDPSAQGKRRVRYAGKARQWLGVALEVSPGAGRDAYDLVCKLDQDPPGKSARAFLEHLMFKGTKKIIHKGKFSELIADLGGRECLHLE
jgi:predicted Zn-dependent peptidase